MINKQKVMQRSVVYRGTYKENTVKVNRNSIKSLNKTQINYFKVQLNYRYIIFHEIIFVLKSFDVVLHE